jgi:hypothetical protein
VALRWVRPGKACGVIAKLQKLHKFSATFQLFGRACGLGARFDARIGQRELTQKKNAPHQIRWGEFIPEQMRGFAPLRMGRPLYVAQGCAG